MTDSSEIIECRPTADGRTARDDDRSMRRVMSLGFGIFGLWMAGSRRDVDYISSTAVAIGIMLALSRRRRSEVVKPGGDKRRAWHDSASGVTTFENFCLRTFWGLRLREQLVCEPGEIGGVALVGLFGQWNLLVLTPEGEVSIPATFEGFDRFAEAVRGACRDRPEAARFALVRERLSLAARVFGWAFPIALAAWTAWRLTG